MCNYCGLRNVSDGIFNDGGNIEDREDYGFIYTLFRKYPVIIDENTKIKVMKMKRTPKLNKDKQQLNNITSENIDEKSINRWYRIFEMKKN